MISGTRREFVAAMAKASASTVLGGACLAVAGEAWAESRQPNVKFPTDARDRVSIASWPFRSVMDSPTNDERDKKLPGMDLQDFAAHVKQKFNVTHIEPYNWHFSSTGAAYLSSFREKLAKAGVHMANIAVDLRQSYYDRDAGTRREAIREAKKWVDIAVQIGSPSVRTSNSPAKNAEPTVERVAESIREVAEYAAERNVVVHLENDNLVSEDAFFIVKVIERANHPFLRALPDFANSMQKGDPGFNYQAVQAMFGHAYGICHVKEGETNEQGQRVNVDLDKTFAILRASGYQGYCSIEYDGPGSPYAATAMLVDATVKALS